MITTDRAQELMYLIRTKTPIRLTDEVGEERLSVKIPFTDKVVDTSDMYSLRDLFEAGVINFGEVSMGTSGTYALEVIFYDDLIVMNDYGDHLEVFRDETINVAIDETVFLDIQQYLRY